MGLAERRAVKNYSETEFPKMKAKIDAVAGFDVPFDIAWDTLAEDDYAHMLEDSIPKVYFMPVLEAFREIAIDDMGKEALKEGVGSVVVRWTGEKTLDFEDGVLTIDHSPISNVDYWENRRDTLQKALEDAL